MGTSASAPIPTLLAFLTCDSVIHDAETQKKTLVGVFNGVWSPGAPLVVSLGLYAKLVEGGGQYTFKIRMVNLKDETAVVEFSAPGNWVEQQFPFEIGVNLRGLPVPAFGDYEFQLFANDVYLGRAVVRVDRLQQPPTLAAPPKG